MAGQPGRSGSGGKREGAGRKPGTPNKTTKQAKATLSELARAETPTAIQTLVDICKKGESESARVSAANALLDRGYGKAPQAVHHSDPSGGAVKHVHRIERKVVHAAPQAEDDQDQDHAEG